jgi:class 3 adenylate cyclase
MVEHNDIAPAAIDFGKRPYETRELRPVTVLFCDIVDSTVLARQLDVEDFQDLVTQFRAVCSEVIDGAGGRVAQTAGDSVLASFGHLTTREDDAERAVKAALNLVQTLRTAKVGPNLRVQVRVGIATGVVAIDDRRDSIDGEAAHLAARLTKWAEPGSILTESRTHELSDAQFDYTDLGSEHLKGFEAPLRVWRVERVRPSRTIFEAKARFR